MSLIPKELSYELQKKMSLTRLAKTGLFKRMHIEGYESISKELLLHRAVLDKALIDGFLPNVEIQQEINEWLNVTNPDFIECCENAMLDPVLVFKTFKAMKEILRGDNAKFRKFGNSAIKKDS